MLADACFVDRDGNTRVDARKPDPERAAIGQNPEAAKSFGARRLFRPRAGTSIRGWDVLRKNLSATEAISGLTNARIGAKRAGHPGVLRPRGGESGLCQKNCDARESGGVLACRFGVGASPRNAAWRKTSSATGATRAATTRARRVALLVAQSRNNPARFAPARPLPGKKRRPRTARELSTNAKKVTVSVLYWYTDFPGSLI